MRACVKVLVAETQVAGREGGMGGAGEVLQEQEVSYWLPGEKNFNNLMQITSLTPALISQNSSLVASLLWRSA